MATIPAAPPSSPGPVTNHETLSYKQLLAFGVGGLPYNLGVEAVKQLAKPVYNILLGVNPVWIGSVLMIARIWDAVADPVLGHLSDNTRTKWGRRRPYIAVGGILSALTFPLVWLVPSGWDQSAAGIYFLVTALLFYSSFSLFSVPFMTLALEMTPDYHERTRVLAYRAVFAAFSSVTLAWAFRLAHSDVFPNAMAGVQVVSIGIAVLFLGGGLIPAIFVKERYHVLAAKQAKQRFWPTFRIVFRNQQFRLLVMLTLVMVMGTLTFNALGIYVTTYYVSGGDVKAAATIVGFTGTISLVVNLTIVPWLSQLSKRWGKINVLQGCMAMGILGGGLKWFLYDPRWPYAQVIMPLFLAPAGSGFWLIVNSMKADVCDLDELDTGIRREGAYASISSWVQQAAAALTFTLTGVILVVIGFDQALGGNQTPSTLLWMRLGFSIAPMLAFAAGMLILKRYQLDEARMAEIRAQLEARRSTV